MVRTIHDGIVEDLRTLRESIDKYSHMGVEKNAKDLKSFAEAILVKLNPDEKCDLNFIESLVYMIRHYDGAKLIGNVKASLDAYLATEDGLKEIEEEKETENHNKFCALLSKIKSVMNTNPLSSYEKDLSEHSCLRIILYRAAENSRERACAQSIIDVIKNESLSSEKKAEKIESFIDSYLGVYDDDDNEGEEFKMNHAAFYDKMKRMAETMSKLQKEEGYGNTAIAEYLRDKRNRGEWTDMVIEDEKDKSLIRDLISITDYTADRDLLVGRCFNKLNDYLNDNIVKKEDTTTTNKKMNHAAFYDWMKRIAETILKKQKNEGNTAVAEFLRAARYSKEWTNIDIEDENDKKFLKDLLLTITYYSYSDDIVNHCLNELSNYLGDETLKKAKTNTSHEKMIELAKDIRGTLIMMRDANTSDDLIATNAFSIINKLKSKLPVEDNNDDRFIKQMVEIAHNYSGVKLVDNLIATIDQWYIFKVEDPNLLSIDELSKKIANKKKMDKENVGYTILCEMKKLVEQTTTKLADNIEEEEFSNSLDKRLINRDLQSLLNSYSNILEILGQYYVKLEK